MPAWRLEIGDDCAPQAVLRDASDDLLEAVKDGDAALTVKLHIANGNLKSGESDGGNAYATVMLEGKDDDHRLSASRNRIKLVNGSHSVTIPLARANWTDLRATPSPALSGTRCSPISARSASRLAARRARRKASRAAAACS